jgi:hypothetical protein
MLRSERWTWLRSQLQARFRRKTANCPTAWRLVNCNVRVLVVGVYLADRPNWAAQMNAALSKSCHCRVDIRWAGLFGQSSDEALAANTVEVLDQPVDKFVIINRLLNGVDLSVYDHLLVIDDDAWLQHGFLDAYIAAVEHCNFALAQPARTFFSYYDHRFTLSRPWLIARQTRFVEIGPVFSVAKRAWPALLPFDTSFPMGWGLDYRWGAQLWSERMGIIDGVPVDHSYRPQSQTYAREDTLRQMNERLSVTPHLSMERARTVVYKYWKLLRWL